jgi:hypothetical protein
VSDIADSCTDRNPCIPGWIIKLKAFYILESSAFQSLRQLHPSQERFLGKPTNSILCFLLEDEETTLLATKPRIRSQSYFRSKREGASSIVETGDILMRSSAIL